MNKFLFVYGTLMKGQIASSLLGSAKYLGRADIQGTMYDLGTFPGVVLSGDNIVFGELYEVSDKLLELLDKYECVPYSYKRCDVQVNCMETGEMIAAQTYELNNLIDVPIIKSGNWLTR